MRETFSRIENEGWTTKTGDIRQYSAWSDKKFRAVIKKFYKVVFGNDEYYPDVIKWIKTKPTKDKSIKKLDMRKFLTRPQIIKLIGMTEGTLIGCIRVLAPH